jgi:hypothetical protein
MPPFLKAISFVKFPRWQTCVLILALFGVAYAFVMVLVVAFVGNNN